MKEEASFSCAVQSEIFIISLKFTVDVLSKLT